MREGVHVYFSGMVQGVGFRYTARRLAQKYLLDGWVRNLSDGRVELFAQGASRSILEFLEDLRNEFKGYITDEEINWVKPEESIAGFTIRF